jgi:hypothetical protein
VRIRLLSLTAYLTLMASLGCGGSGASLSKSETEEKSYQSGMQAAPPGQGPGNYQGGSATEGNSGGSASGAMPKQYPANYPGANRYGSGQANPNPGSGQ